MRLLLLLALAGCTRHEDSCAGIVGPCVSVHLDSAVMPIDQISIMLDGGASRFTPQTPANVSFPVRFAVTLPASVGSAHLDFGGLSMARAVAAASADVPLGAGGHADISVTLRAPKAPPDLAGADLAGADLSELPDLTEVDLAGADLTPLPDLAPAADLAAVFPLTVSVRGTGSGTVAVDGANCAISPCTFNKPAGATVTTVAVPNGGSSLVAMTGSCSSTSTTCTFTINGPSAISANFKSTSLSMLQVVPVPVSVTNAQFFVTPSPAPAATCGSNCYLYPTGASVALSWTLISGQFLGWGGVSAACRNAFTCNVKVDNDMGVTASYSDSVPNYAFVSSAAISVTSLAASPLTTADTFCVNSATNAGLPDATSFRAWLSVAGTPAPSRFAGAAGWVRPDGLPIGNSPAALVGTGSPWYPLIVNENGVVEPVAVWTGTNPDGTTGTNCSNWSDAASASLGIIGISTDGGGGWNSYSPGSCANTAALYCFGTAHNSSLSFSKPSGARTAFVSTSLQNGAADGDGECQSEAVSAGLSGRFRAWRNHPAASGLIVFDQTLGPWVRLDNVLLAPHATQTLLDGATYQQLAPLHQTNRGAYLDQAQAVWIGDPTGTCGDWTTTTGTGGFYVATRIHNTDAAQPCTTTSHWYCLQE